MGDIAMDRSDENKLAYGTYLPNKVYFSTNNGVSFTASTTDLHSDIRSVDMKDNRVLEGSDGERAVHRWWCELFADDQYDQ